MKKIRCSLIALCALFAVHSFGQDNAVAKRGLSLSIGPDAALPVGTFHNLGNNFGIGGSAKLAIPLASHFDVTLGAGYMAFGKSKLKDLSEKSLTFIPFKGGIRYSTSATKGGFYIEPQAGITQMKFQGYEGDANFSYALNLGYLISNALDLSVRYDAVNNKEDSPAMGTSYKLIGLRLAYNFNFAKSN